MGNCCNDVRDKKHIINDDELIEYANQLKEKGNTLYAQCNYLQALDAYSEAIRIYDKESIYYSNRAVTFRQLEKYAEAKQDARLAISLNDQNARAHFLLGTILLIEAQLYHTKVHLSSGFNSLKKARSIPEIKPSLLNQIDNNLKAGELLEINIQIEEEEQEKHKLIAFLKSRDKHNIDFSIFLKKRKLNSPNDYIYCSITQDIFIEPILVSSGHTYEKSALLQNFAVNGQFDPNTRASLQHSNHTPNLHVVEAIVEYKKDQILFQ